MSNSAVEKELPEIAVAPTVTYGAETWGMRTDGRYTHLMLWK